MLSARDFSLLVSVDKKADSGEQLTADEQDAVTRLKPLPRKLCGCGCGVRLEPRIDGERHKISGAEVNSDCYFRSMGSALESHPIGGHGIRCGGVR